MSPTPQAPAPSRDKTFRCPARQGTDSIALDRWVPMWTTQHPGEIQRPGYVVWRWHWTPLVCSACNSLAPPTAIRLIAEGWEVEQSGDPMWQSVHPPGYWACHADMLRSIQSDGLQGWERPEGQWTPRPAAQVCALHFTEEARGAFWQAQHAAARTMEMGQ